jgi:Leucine-rich repeat (LRR) protein
MTSPNQQNNGGVINVNELEKHKNLSNKYTNSFVKPSNLLVKLVAPAGDSLLIDMESVKDYYSQWVSEGNESEQRSEAVKCIVNAVENNATELDLSALKLTEIPHDIGLFLPGLTELNLNQNQLTNLPANVFNSLTNLEWLELSSNQLTELPENVFNSLTKLYTLNLVMNNLTSLPETIFQSLTNLRSLDLDSNTLQTLPETVFKPLTNLTWLALVFNKLQTLPKTVFQSLTKLTWLRLDGNRLTNLDPTTFQSLTKLEKLGLDANRLTNLDPTIFQSLANLSELYLNDNHLVRFELSTDAQRALQNAHVCLGNNQLNADTVRSLIEAQTVPDYVGPRYELSIHDPNAINTADITSQDLPKLVPKWQNIQNIDPQWASLAHRSELNTMAIFLARLWNECPRDANHEIPTSTRTMVQRILSAFEAIMNNGMSINDQLQTPFMGACMAAAETGVGACIDKIGVGLILMDRQAALSLTNNPQEKEAINRDLRRIQTIIHTVEQFNSNQLYYDTELNKVVNVATGRQSINQYKNELEAAYRHSDYTDYATCAYDKGEGVLPEIVWRALQWNAINTIRQNKHLTPYTQIRIGDEVEDIFGLINKGIDDKYLTTLSKTLMRFGGCRAIKGGSDQESAVMAYLKGLPEN